MFGLTNLGGAAITNGLATVGAGPFSVLAGTPFNLPGLGSTNLVVRFSPISEGSFSNVVTFSSNGGNSTNTVIGSGAQLPTANFNGSPTIGIAPLTVTFTDSSAGTITNRFWNFGDGSTTNTSGSGLTHTYQTAQTSSVSLVVSGPVGGSSLTRSSYIVAGTS